MLTRITDSDVVTNFLQNKLKVAKSNKEPYQNIPIDIAIHSVGGSGPFWPDPDPTSEKNLIRIRPKAKKSPWLRK
jgi:hypothetical protein